MIEAKVISVDAGMNIYERQYDFAVRLSVPTSERHVPIGAARDLKKMLSATVEPGAIVRILAPGDVLIAEATNEQLLTELARRLNV